MVNNNKAQLKSDPIIFIVETGKVTRYFYDNNEALAVHKGLLASNIPADIHCRFQSKLPVNIYIQ